MRILISVLAVCSNAFGLGTYGVGLGLEGPGLGLEGLGLGLGLDLKIWALTTSQSELETDRNSVSASKVILNAVSVRLRL